MLYNVYDLPVVERLRSVHWTWNLLFQWIFYTKQMEFLCLGWFYPNKKWNNISCVEMHKNWGSVQNKFFDEYLSTRKNTFWTFSVFHLVSLGTWQNIGNIGILLNVITLGRLLVIRLENGQINALVSFYSVQKNFCFT